MTDTTMRMTTTATTAPMIAQDPLPEGVPPPVLGGSWVDGPILLLPPTATELLLSGLDDSTAIGSLSEEDEKWDIAAVLCEILVATVIDELEIAATEVLGESGADNVIDDTEVDDSTAIGNCSDEDGEWGNATVLGETLAVVATATDERIADFDETTAEFDETEVLVTSCTAQSK